MLSAGKRLLGKVEQRKHPVHHLSAVCLVQRSSQHVQQFCISGAIVFFVLFFCVTSPLNSAQSLHDEAVSLARSGKYNEAIALLKPQYTSQPNNERLAHDLIVIYTWNENFDKACELYEQQDMRSYPIYVQKAVVSAYRKLNQPEKAFEIVEHLLQENPADIELLRHKVILLVAKNQIVTAKQILEDIGTKTGKDSDFYRLSGDVHTAEEKWLLALADYQRIAELQPGDEQAIREQFATLRHARAPEAAGEILAKHPELFTIRDRALFLLNQAAEQLRWSTDATHDFEETELLAMQALAKQLKAMEMLKEDSAIENWSVSVLHDIVVTLRNLRRMDDVEVLYHHLLENGEVPNYVADATAGAKLANKKPDESEEIYHELLEYKPNSYQQQIGLFYSYVQEEDFDEAYDLIDTMHEEEPVFQKTLSKTQPYPNDRYLNLGVFSLSARFYADQLEEAWKRADTLVKNAPNNNWLWEVRGQIANARQWHEQALYDYHYARLLEPDSLYAMAGEVSSLLAMARFDEARPLLEQIQEQFPKEHATKEALKQWKFSRKPMYFGDITWQESSGPEIDGDSITAHAELLSAPIFDHLYIDALYRYAWAELIEGEETFQRYSLGLDYRIPDWTFLGRVTDNHSTVTEVGGSFTAIWQPDDFWRISAGGEIFSVDTPLRALYHGIKSDSVYASALYRWSEQRWLSLNVSGYTFTDDNERVAGGAIFSQRLLDVPHYDLDGRIELYGSTNSKENVPYFSPGWDYSIKGALHLDHVYWRSHDHLLAHQADVGYGYYSQKGYPTLWIGHIRYEQRYKLTPWVEMLAGIEFGRGVYDGEPEPYRLIRLMITGKI